MRKIFSLSFFIASLFFIGACNTTNTNPNSSLISCDKDSTIAPEHEVAFLQNYITTNAITAKKDPSGYFYTIDSVGEGDKVQRCNTIQCDYKATLLDGSYIDHGTAATFPIHQLIKGWQQGLTHIAKNGAITLYLPPTLAYGAVGSSPAIGQNEYLKFTVKVLNVTSSNPQ